MSGYLLGNLLQIIFDNEVKLIVDQFLKIFIKVVCDDTKLIGVMQEAYDLASFASLRGTEINE